MIILLIDAQKNKARIENQRLRDAMDPFLIPTDRLVTFLLRKYLVSISISILYSFIEKYRMPPVLVQTLISELSPFIEDDCDNKIPLHLRVLVTLNFYGSGCYQRRIGTDAFGMMSQSMISKSISEISKAITNNLGNQYIKFPRTEEEVKLIKKRFVEDHGLPGVLALVDGTQIRISGVPLEVKRLYIKKSRYTTVNTQIVIDSDTRILNINARYPGSTHDAHIWKNSKVFTLLEANFNLEDQSENIYRNSFLLGDLGYPLQPWLMIPVKDVGDDQINEKLYNRKHRRIRSKIERFNACFKNRWRCILGERALRYSHEKVGYIIYACATLHNFLINYSFDVESHIPPFLGDETRSDGDRDESFFVEEDEYLRRGEIIRDQLIADYF